MATLYLIRHGLAAPREEYVANDTVRPLTEAGTEKTRAVAQRLKDFGLRFNPILTSPLKRAYQTAVILQQEGLGSLEIFPPLAPDGQLSHWLDWLGQQTLTDKTALALVGHEPDLSQWVEQLVWGDRNSEPGAEPLILKKAGVIGLTLPNQGSPVGTCQLFWLTPPRFLV